MAVLEGKKPEVISILGSLRSYCKMGRNSLLFGWQKITHGDEEGCLQCFSGSSLCCENRTGLTRIVGDSNQDSIP